MKGPPWTAEDYEYLEEHWGSRSIPAIAKVLGRTVNAVKIKAARRSLGPHLLGSDKISAHMLRCTIMGRREGVYTLDRWIRMGLPTHRHKVNDCSVLMVDIPEFWRWAETNKGVINFSFFEEGALGSEPDWVREKRRHDRDERHKKTAWSMEEDAILEHMLRQHRYTYTDLAAVLDRSHAAIKTRIYDRGLDLKPVRSQSQTWTVSQETTLLEMHADGRTWDAIGAQLGRTGGAARARYELIMNRQENDSNAN